MSRSVHIIGVPLDLGGGRRGVDMGPSAFRIAGLGERITSLGIPVIDRGNIAVPVRETLDAGDHDRKYIDEIAQVCSDLYATSLASLGADAIPVVLGATIASVRAPWPRQPRRRAIAGKQRSGSCGWTHTAT